MRKIKTPFPLGHGQAGVVHVYNTGTVSCGDFLGETESRGTWGSTWEGNRPVCLKKQNKTTRVTLSMKLALHYLLGDPSQTIIREHKISKPRKGCKKHAEGNHEAAEMRVNHIPHQI